MLARRHAAPLINLREAHFGSCCSSLRLDLRVLLLFTIGRFPATARNAWRLVFVLSRAYLGAARYLWWRSAGR